MAMRRASRASALIGFVALFGLALLAAPAGASEGCPEHPCKGWTYQIVYRTSDGVIIGWSGYNEGNRLNLAPGTAAIDVTDDPRLVDLRTLPKYYVDIQSRQIRAKAGYVAPQETPSGAETATPTEPGLGLALPVLVGGVFGAASFATRRLVRRRGVAAAR